MSSELNKIFPNSSITIQKVVKNTLCFIDNKAVFSNKYLISSNKLDIYQQALENISLFYGFDAGISYEFDAVLNNIGTIIEGNDKSGNTLQNLTQNNVMVFVNGILLRKDEFEILDSSSLALKVVIPQNLFQQVLVFVSNTDLGYLSLTGDRINKDYNPSNPDPLVYNHSVLTYYDINHSIVFINGIKVNSESIKKDSEYININADIQNSDLIEIYTLNTSIKSLNFYTTFGYMTYGPLDSNNNKIPTLYNTLITFDDIAKLAVDNLRSGFFIKENSNHGGTAIIVDNNFETNTIKCLVDTEDFQGRSYFHNEYYLEVPTGKNIVEYLSDHDRKFRMLPEILDIFHNVILKEVYDSIIRLRDIRNISKVDSYHINKLIKFLGFDTSINHLSLKQKHALLEELNNFYRIVGTRDSYDMFNIIQDDIKIVDIEQLFTPHVNVIVDDSSQLSGHYVYNITNYDSLSDWKRYYAGNRVYFNVEDSNNPNVIIPFTFTVSEVDSRGRILAVDPDRVDGVNYNELERFRYFQPVKLELKATITTVGNLYTNSYRITNSQGFTDNVTLVSEDNEYMLKVTSISDGVITGWEVLKGPLTSNIDLTKSNIPLRIKDISDIQLSVTSTEKERTTIVDTQASGDISSKNIILEPGYYKFNISGGGGGGASADYGQRGESDLYADYGENATKLEGDFQITTPSTLSYIIGTGGKSAYARWHKWSSNNGIVGNPGVGYESGKPGIKQAFNESGYSHWGRWCVSGSGGGSTRIFINHVIDKVAPGGKGGKVHDNLTPGDGGSYYMTNKNTAGAKGGSGTNPTGAWSGTYYPPMGKFWSFPGEDGWVKIYKIKNQYTFSITGDQSTVSAGSEYNTQNNEFKVKITGVSGEGSNRRITEFIATPTEGAYNYNNQQFPLLYINNNHSAKLQITSTLTSSDYSISSPSGSSTPYLFAGAELTATLTDEAKQQYPDYADFSVRGQVRYFNNTTNEATVFWDWSTTDKKVSNFSNTPLNLEVACGNGAGASTNFVRYENTRSIQEYVDFFTKEELGAEHIKTYVKDAINYGTITEGTPNSPRPYQVGKPDIDYGIAKNGEEDVHEDYGTITEYTGGKYVDYWLWERDPKYYPTNHVNVEIKIEASDDQENIINRFYKQFYDLASTVLYIHRLTCSYFFGNTTDNVSTGIVSPIDSPVFFGIQTGQSVSYEVYTLTSDPDVQITDDNVII